MAELKTEEREVTARLTWKILEEPVLVNGAVASLEQPEQLLWPQPTAQLPEKPKEDKVQQEEEQSSFDEPLELRVVEEQLGSEAEEPSTSPEEQEPQPDFYSCDLYSSGLSTAISTAVAWPQVNTVRNHFLLLLFYNVTITLHLQIGFHACLSFYATLVSGKHNAS